MSNSYESVRYPGMPFVQTHPDRLATMATLFGMAPAPIESARVLEIGCCDGGNLIPMAVVLPQARFVGIDLTAADIAAATETAIAVGLHNIQFHALDLTSLPGGLGQFDYVIAHGVYSWVPDPVREKLLAVIHELLAPNGVAYVSYNTMPGGHLRLMLRDIMLFHTRGVQDPALIISRSREILEFIAATHAGNGAYHAFVAHEIEVMFNRPDYGLFHDELDQYYKPVYFHEFVSHAARYRLQYLSEANFFDMSPGERGMADMPLFTKLGEDRILREQYMDFARGRAFRQTLLCRSGISLDPVIRHERLTTLKIASPARQVLVDDSGTEFHGSNKSKVKTAHPLVLKLLHFLIEHWPLAVAFQDLPDAASHRDELCEIIMNLFGAGLIELRVSSPVLAVVPGERPLASPLARLQAARSLPVTTLRHFNVLTGGGIENRLISLLDGSRTRDELFAALAPLLSTNKTQAEHMAELEISLNSLARMGMLIS